MKLGKLSSWLLQPKLGRTENLTNDLHSRNSAINSFQAGISSLSFLLLTLQIDRVMKVISTTAAKMFVIRYKLIAIPYLCFA
jgi:hypothetical protein